MIFSPGSLVATPGALAALDGIGVDPLTLLARHLRADWGDLDREDKKANDLAVGSGARIFSAYQLTPQLKVYVITEAVGDDGKRESTCILLPEEY